MGSHSSPAIEGKMKLKTLYRGKEEAIVEAGSKAEADLIKIGFAEKKAKPKKVKK